jgi:hypothetical protein
VEALLSGLPIEASGSTGYLSRLGIDVDSVPAKTGRELDGREAVKAVNPTINPSP